jgi:RNA polymerase sigma-70 factor (ECF subfamily)
MRPHASPSGTSPTLLGRLQSDPTDQAAWSTFVDRYGPQIYGWCRQRQLQESDARDVTQNVLLRLAEKLRAFRYDPARSFRAWLKTLTYHAWSDFLASRRRPGAGSGDSAVWEVLHSVEARDDLCARLEEEFDRELLDEAMARVRLRLAPAKWEVFRLMAIEGLSGAEAAAKVGMKVSTAFVVRSKVQKLLQAQVRELEGADATPTEDDP